MQVGRLRRFDDGKKRGERTERVGQREREGGKDFPVKHGERALQKREIGATPIAKRNKPKPMTPDADVHSSRILDNDTLKNFTGLMQILL
jgi:hypothetical protein